MYDNSGWGYDINVVNKNIRRHKPAMRETCEEMRNSMELYFGGAYQGKLDYVCGRKNIVKELGNNAEDTANDIYSEEGKYITNKKHVNNIADGAYCSIEDIKNACILNHFHLLIKRLLKEGKCTDTLIDTIYDSNPSIIIICDEVGSGIVPLEKEDRIYRETVGRMLCRAVKKSDRVERIACGIGQCLKGE